MEIMPLLLKDGYKVDHRRQYPADTEYIYSNLTPRAGRSEGIGGIIFFGMQYFLQDGLLRQFGANFFDQPLDKVMQEYKTVIDSYLGPDAITYEHIKDLHELGYLPLLIKAVPEGTLVPYGVPCLTIINTHPKFFWLTNMLETLMSSMLWKMCTSATTAFMFRKNFQTYADKTSDSGFLVPWQGHDFSFRGMSGWEDAMMSGAAHLTSFTGSDTIPAIALLRDHYFADPTKMLVAGSVPATEHSVMCMGGQETEIETFRRLLKLYPSGIVSVVSDTWDYWKVLREVLPALEDEIMARDGKLVIRPDSGDPVDIICGAGVKARSHQEYIGTIATLWELFGGTINSKGYKELDSHIGCIYGDSITLDKQQRILAGLEEKGFASTNIVMGVGSYTYQYTTRDVHGFAMKATWGQTKSLGAVEIFKDPATDRAVGGVKKSHKGLLAVYNDESLGRLVVREQCTKQEELGGVLQVVFENGLVYNRTTLTEIRNRVETYL